jgi:hypothetical protein
MVRQVRKKVTWKDGARPAAKEKRLPWAVPEIPCEGPCPDLKSGGLFLTKVNLEIIEYSVGTVPHEFKYLGETWLSPQEGRDRILKTGSVAIYAGNTRVNEQDGKGNVVARLRHTFIIEGRRFMTNNLNHYVPAAEFKA